MPITPDLDRAATLCARLAEAIGTAAVSEAPARLALMGHDVYRSGGEPAVVVRPASVSDLRAAVRVCAAAGVAMVPRGGGASYTDGYLHPAGGHVLFDLGAIDTIEIDLENALVTVGPGVTWAALRTALADKGLRTPFWGPFSGLVATVGGSVSQNALSHGSAGHGISAQSVLSMDVVLASGELMRTGAADTMRNYGPDITGLFTGDCGALGIKVAIRLPLIAMREHFRGLSFAFDDFAAFHAGVREAAIERLDDAHFGLDLALSQGQIGKQEGVTSRLGIIRDVLRSAPNKRAGLRQIIRMGVAGKRALRGGAFMAHFMIEGVEKAEVAAKARRLQALLAPYGCEIANSVPAYVRAVPFAPLVNILGPSGERWAPLHGVLTHENALPFHNALTALYADRRGEMQRLGVWTGAMFSSVGSTGFLYEVALYWPDELTPYHTATLGRDHLTGLKIHAANVEAHAFVARLKQDVMTLYVSFDAAHFQVGRVYPYREALDPVADKLLANLKATLDPDGLMNPGALNL